MTDLPYPRISLVVPAFRAGATIERTLKSILAQNYPDLQLIVMDGGSQDGSVEIIKRYEASIAYWVSEPDKGQVDALNKGFARADGELYGWLCADDELMPGALLRVGDEFRARPDMDVLTGGCARNFNDKFRVETIPDPNFLSDLGFKNTIEQPSTFWRAVNHKAAGPLDGSYRYAFDWEYWCRLRAFGATFHAIPDILSLYHFSDDNLTSTGGRKIADEMYRIIRTYGPYQGRIADTYRFLYKTFDLRGFYDKENRETLPAWKKSLFHTVLRFLYWRYDAHTINSYNWNFVSRQERGMGW